MQSLPQGRRRYSLQTPEAVSWFVYDRRSPLISTINLGISRPLLQLPKQSKTTWCLFDLTASDQCDTGSLHHLGHLESSDFVENPQSLIRPLPPARLRKIWRRAPQASGRRQ